MAIKDILETFSGEVSDFASTGIVLRDEGTSIARFDRGEVDAAAGDAYLAELLKQHLRALEGLELESETEDLVLETSHGLLLARPLDETDYLWTVITGPGANVALTRALMRKFEERVIAEVP